MEESTFNGRNGSYQVRRQVGWIQLPNGETRRIRVRLDRATKPHGVGRFAVGPGSFTVSEYGDLQLGTLDLVPVSGK